MATIATKMRMLRNCYNEKNILMYVELQKTLMESSATIYRKYKLSIPEISNDLDIEYSNAWRYVMRLSEKGLINVVKTDRGLEIIL